MLYLDHAFFADRHLWRRGIRVVEPALVLCAGRVGAHTGHGVIAILRGVVAITLAKPDVLPQRCRDDRLALRRRQAGESDRAVNRPVRACPQIDRDDLRQRQEGGNCPRLPEIGDDGDAGDGGKHL